MRSLKSLFNYKTLCFCIIFILVSLFCYNYFMNPSINSVDLEAGRLEILSKEKKGVGEIAYCFRNINSYEFNLFKRRGTTYDLLCWLTSEMNKRNWVTPPETSINGVGYTDIGLYNAFGDNPDEFVVFFSFNKYGIITYCYNIKDYFYYNERACKFYLNSMAELYIKNCGIDYDISLCIMDYTKDWYDFIPYGHPVYDSIYSQIVLEHPEISDMYLGSGDIAKTFAIDYLDYMTFVFLCLSVSYLLYSLIKYLLRDLGQSLKDYVKSISWVEWLFTSLSIVTLVITLC